jgi:hypothetical protein
LIANTAPVAYGALGTPIAGLASVTGLDPFLLGAMVGRNYDHLRFRDGVHTRTHDPRSTARRARL